jgi:hypothetical protein
VGIKIILPTVERKGTLLARMNYNGIRGGFFNGVDIWHGRRDWILWERCTM